MKDFEGILYLQFIFYNSFKGSFLFVFTVGVFTEKEYIIYFYFLLI